MCATFNIVLATNTKYVFIASLHHFLSFNHHWGTFNRLETESSNESWLKLSLGTPNSKSLWGSKWTNCGASSGERPSWRLVTELVEVIPVVVACWGAWIDISTQMLMASECYISSVIANSKSHLPFTAVFHHVVWYLPQPWSLCHIHL